MPEPKKFWQFRNQTDGKAELLLYGDISETSWWGDEITPKQFANDLNTLGPVSEISVRINSGGGDVFAAQTIGNLLEQHCAFVTAKIDGLCASAATIIACHCNKVVAAADSAYMIHPVRMVLHGAVDTTELQQFIDALNVLRENIVSLYAKKTGKEKEEVAKWMDNTTWWTAEQAKENGFVDELTDHDEDAVVENRNGVLFINSVSMGLPFAKTPEFVRDGATEPSARRSANKKPAGRPDLAKEVHHMEDEIKTVDGLRNAYPELVAQIEQAATENAAKAERERIKAIEDVALPGSETLVNDAKFVTPMSVSDFAVALVRDAKTKGSAFLDAMREDGQDSGANGVGNAPVPEDKDCVATAIAQAKQDAAVFLNGGKNKGGHYDG